MNFRVDRWSAAALRTSLVAVTMAGTLLLASCGGGNGNENQSEKFSPTRMVVFGDESSLLLPPSSPTALDARKYGINGFTADTTPANSVPDCFVNPIWVQFLAFKFGLTFAECNPGGAPVTAFMRAANGAKVADVMTAIDTFIVANGKFGKKDLVTILVGSHDILELHDRVTNGANPAPLTEAAALAEAERRASLLAGKINDLTNLKNTLARVMYVAVPDLAQSPFGIAAEPGVDYTDRLMHRISQAFNDELRIRVDINGRSIGSLNAYQRFRNIIDAVNDGDEPFGIFNASDGACTTALPDCTTLTLQATADAFNWLWADATHLSAGGQDILGQDATDLIDNLPF